MSRHAPDIRVTDTGAIRTLQIGRIQQSSMYLDAPFDTDFDYPAYLHLTLAVTPHARRLLMIGVGGATVIKRMWRDYPELTIAAVEIDPVVAGLARSAFGLPDDPRIRLHVDDGRAFLERSEGRWDIVIVDAFEDEHVPRPLLTEEFARLVVERLGADGVLAYNMHGSVTGARSKPFRRLHRTLRTAFARVWAFPVGLSHRGGPAEHREIIVLATNAPTGTDELLAAIADRVGGRVTVPEFDGFGADLYRDGVRSGDVATYRDGSG